MAKIEFDNGLVSVDGTVEHRRRCKIRSDQAVAYGGQTIKAVQIND